MEAITEEIPQNDEYFLQNVQPHKTTYFFRRMLQIIQH
jgi:hypothetical protein